ncbi:MAG: nicotinate phosphoribosyltransferase, partial [Bacteroidia bacterium]|nr:nicotinate phosphoribosyltransferase [Bacteroidia bacterium]MDW8334572.1 nicotinate phosphoribosyltransferase [Bacteroidia bacterium]
LWAMREGEVVFAFEPIVRVKAALIEAQLIETMLLNILNFQTLIATKAMRMRYAAGARTLMEFGLRRAHGRGGVQASRAAVVGGFDATSNVLAAQRYGLNVGGTMAHAWVQAFGDELEAFRRFARIYPDKTTLLIDTYDVLGSGLPNALVVAQELRAQGHELFAVRIDSGDLAYLSKKARHALDQAGFQNVKIFVTNDLDERLIASLLAQDAPIDGFGVGTKLVTAYDQPALGGVYKLISLKGKPRIKVSENVVKTTLPGVKTAWRYVDESGAFMADGVGPESAVAPSRLFHPFEPDVQTSVERYKPTPLLEKVMSGGKLVGSLPTVAAAADYARARFARLPDEHKRFDHPHIYRVGVAKQTLDLRRRLSQQFRRA